VDKAGVEFAYEATEVEEVVSGGGIEFTVRTNDVDAEVAHAAGEKTLLRYDRRELVLRVVKGAGQADERLLATGVGRHS
jgi:hypothetical protein